MLSGKILGTARVAKNTEFFLDKYHETYKTGSKDLPKWSQNLPVATKRHPRASRGLPKGAQVGQSGSQAGCQAALRVVQRGPQGIPRAPQGSPQVPRPLPGELLGRGLGTYFWGSPKRSTKMRQNRFQDLSVKGEK